MRLLLHIGTHKTGTSSLQQVLQLNEQILKDNGILYARRPRSRNSNYMAKLLATGNSDDVKKFIHKNISRARSIGAHTLVISAESLYAMTKLFHDLEGRRRQSYWQSEASLVNQFAEILPPDIDTTVFVCFRRQDQFIESIYGQLIKSRMITFGIDEFVTFMREILDYHRHMEIWRQHFPDIVVCSYENLYGQISKHFFFNILQLPSSIELKSLELKTNERISRDVLEYKRILNQRSHSKVERRLNSKICSELSNIFPAINHSKDYLSVNARNELMLEMGTMNELLVKEYGMERFPEISSQYNDSSSSYSGLSPEKEKEIAECHKRIMRSFGYRKEKFGLIIGQIIRQKLPLFRWAIPIGRVIMGEQKLAK